jgi:hypothetical protein
MDEMGAVLIYGWTQNIVEPLLWAIAGCVFFRLFSGKKKTWFLGAFTTGIVYFLYHTVFFNWYIRESGTQVTAENQELNSLFQETLENIDFVWDIILPFVIICIGFIISQKIIDIIIAKAAQSGR